MKRNKDKKYTLEVEWVSLVAQTVESAGNERDLGWEDPRVGKNPWRRAW